MTISASMPIGLQSNGIHTAEIVAGNKNVKATTAQPFSGLRGLMVAVVGLACLANRTFAAVSPSQHAFSGFPLPAERHGKYSSAFQHEIATLLANHAPVKHENGVVTQGPLQDGELHGYGIKRFSTGGTDEGLFENGNFVYGRRTYPENDGAIKVLIGGLFNNEFEGEGCSIRYLNANNEAQLLAVAEGTCRNGVVTEGTSVYRCGDALIENCNTTKIGQLSPDGKLINGIYNHYDGVQATGKFDGEEHLIEGLVVLSDGTQLNGTYQDGQLRGPHCSAIHSNGLIERGTFDTLEAMSRKQGRDVTGIVAGERVYVDGTSIHCTFLDGREHGENCTVIHPNGKKEQASFINGKYVGCINQEDIYSPAGSYYKLADGVTICPPNVAEVDTKTKSEAKESSLQKTNQNDAFDWTFGWKKVLFG